MPALGTRVRWTRHSLLSAGCPGIKGPGLSVGESLAAGAAPAQLEGQRQARSLQDLVGLVFSVPHLPMRFWGNLTWSARHFPDASVSP